LKPVFSAPVRGIVEQVLRSGDLDLMTFSNFYDQDPIRIHQMIQGRRPAEYSSEVPVSCSMEREDFILNIGGRIDGVYEYPDRAVIDEIKTVNMDPDDAIQKRNELHWGQAKCYAYIYAREHDLEEIEVQLTYYSTGTRTQREIREIYSVNALEDFMEEIVTRYIVRLKIYAEWQTLRNELIKTASFPYPGYRSGQTVMIDEVGRAIENSEQLLIQAPTGIGKTMAALFPAIKSLVEERSEKVLFLTARTTGRIAAEKAVTDMLMNGLRIKSVSLTAKDRICPFPDSMCTPAECSYAKGHYDRLNDAIDEGFTYDLITGDVISELSRKHEVCPFEFSLDLSLWADCIICDYNYVFDPRVHLQRYFGEGKRPYTFIIDEAHNLVDRARDMFSAELDKEDVLDVRRAVHHKLPDIYRILNRINTLLIKLRKECDQTGGAYYSREMPEDLDGLLVEFMSVTRRWLAENKKTDFRQKLTELFFAANHYLTIHDLYDSRYVTSYKTESNDLRVKLFCIDPSMDMSAALNRGSSAIFMSATLVPMNYFSQILGCDSEARKVILQSPFPEENLEIVISTRLSTLYRHRNATKLGIARMLMALGKSRSGNYLFYFPSYAYLNLVYDCFMEIDPDISTIRQKPNLSEEERSYFLSHFRKDNDETLVGFAVLGGVFGEGIDLTGDRLTGAAIVGVGLPGISPERDCIRNYFDETDQKGFEFAYQYPGINKVLQAAGRVIRTENDMGVVLLIDQRFGTHIYKELLPDHWKPQYINSQEYLLPVLKKFWRDR
jgi:DNA excision repair protein ERCC-2